MGTDSSALFGGDGGQETDWRGIPIEKHDVEKSARERKLKEIEETTQATNNAPMVRIQALEERVRRLEERIIDGQGAD
jgi:polyhydroxyalkanoate synthesis regulator phasin